MPLYGFLPFREECLKKDEGRRMIILSIPFINENFVKEQFGKYRTKFDFLEFRLDYHQDYRSFPVELLQPNTIVTMKKNSDLKFLRKLVEKYDCFIDLEIENFISESPSKSKIKSDNLILSFHDFNEKTNFEKMKNIIRISNYIPARFLKIAVNISAFSDFLKIPALIEKSNKPVVFVGMGNLGKISRILYRQLGSVGTFIGIANHLTAEGQISEIEAEMYRLDKIGDETKIGGIIGGEQVTKSLGLTFYNDYFRENNLNAVYLPFVVTKLDDFLYWIRKSKFRFYGFSVTMPHKKKIGNEKRKKRKEEDDFSNEGENEFPVYNLFLPEKNEFFNTELIAFQKAIKFLKIKINEKILIFGSGGSAETALFAFQKFPLVYLSSRNENMGRKLSEKFWRNFISQRKPNSKKFDIIINCTPLGMNNEDFLRITNLSLSTKIIDLPYGEEKTPLIKECETQKALFVDGRMFWKWQAEMQLKIFEEEIENEV